MEGIRLLRDLLQPNDWIGKIDLKDAYFVVTKFKNHQKFLRFRWKDSLMEFTCVLFGLASVPRILTKLMKPVAALLRRSSIRLIVYLDDILVMNQTATGLQRDISTATQLLENLGFVINLTKSQLKPYQIRVKISVVSSGYLEYDTCSSPGESDSNQISLLSDAVSERTH